MLVEQLSMFQSLFRSRGNNAVKEKIQNTGKWTGKILYIPKKEIFRGKTRQPLY